MLYLAAPKTSLSLPGSTSTPVGPVRSVHCPGNDLCGCSLRQPWRKEAAGRPILLRGVEGGAACAAGPAQKISISKQGYPAPVALASPRRCWVSLLTFFFASSHPERVHHPGFHAQPWTLICIHLHCISNSTTDGRHHIEPFQLGDVNRRKRGPPSPNKRRQLIPWSCQVRCMPTC